MEWINEFAMRRGLMILLSLVLWVALYRLVGLWLGDA
jgi:hypothetical protein